MSCCRCQDIHQSTIGIAIKEIKRKAVKHPLMETHIDTYRTLTETDIRILIEQGCKASNWQTIKIAPALPLENIQNTIFQGEVTLGDEHITEDQSINISNCKVVDCSIANGVTLSNVHLIQNYQILENTIIENVNSMTVQGESAFGNGETLDILNEGGGRELTMFDTLSAQIAWLQIRCRHNTLFSDKLQQLINTYVTSKKSTRGIIGKHVSIKHTNLIEDVNIGDYCQINGAVHLLNGTIRSRMEDPVMIGNGVIARNFIIQEGSHIYSAAMLHHCFIGQGVMMGKQYSAEHSAIFANSECFHGEGLSIFAGPYTVTHHKSSLLIAGQYSFYNAGSGSNQSNHMYKLGPLHQGIVERGSKTGSFSYMLWPSRVGPFSVVMGKHTSSFDSGDFPFSYITEEQGKSVLTPAMNLFSVGTSRDIEKWPNRDRRKAKRKFDLIHFDFLTPYIMERVMTARDQLLKLYKETPKERESVFLNGLHIYRLMLRTCSKYYQIAMKVYMGQELIKKLGEEELRNFAHLEQHLTKHTEISAKHWVDMVGMLTPVCQLEKLMQEISEEHITDLTHLHERLIELYLGYHEWSWSYCWKLIKQEHQLETDDITPDLLLKVITDWKDNSLKLNKMILTDAEKEFDAVSRIGYGITNQEDTINSDFAAVRGASSDNKKIKALHQEQGLIEEKAGEMIKLVESLKEERP
ncbi:DUF4954 family protein [Puteibacter caeruleilacunae]|nr:DUF4954 family protein [Puteibacter caeruleilacunae]